MAVIREKKQFGIGPIGVARVQQPIPGSNAAGSIAQAVQQSADQMADMFFRAGAKKAEQFGTEQASAVAREQILAIDPATGAPTAYETPKGFGTIAQDAYQRVILSRFQSSVEEEIKFKAKELAAIHDGSVDRYSAAMSEYIGAMASNAQGQFQTYIKDVGTSYLNATRTAMAIDQINRERAAAAKAQEASIAAGNDALRRLIAADGAASIVSTTPTPASVTGTSIDAAIRDARDAELITADQVLQLDSSKRLAIATGQIEYLASNAKTSAEAKRIHLAITSGDLSLVQDPSLKLVMSTLSYEDRKDLEKVSEDFLGDRSDYLDAVEQEEKAAYEAQNIIAAARIDVDAGRAASQITYNAATAPINAVLDVTRETYSNDTLYAAQLDAAGRNAEADSVRKRAKVHFDASVAGVYNRALIGADVAETNAIERAVRNRDPSMAPAGRQDSVAAIIALENISTGVIESFGSVAQSHKEDTGKIITSQNQTAALVQTQDVIQQVGLAMTSFAPAGIDSSFSSGEAAIMSSGMDEDQKLNLRKDLANSAAIANLSYVFRNTQPTREQMNAMATYITDGVSTGVLTQPQMEALDNVRKFQGISENPSAVSTQLGKYIQQREEEYIVAEKAQEKARLFYDISTGAADGSNQSVRLAADEMFSRKYPELGGMKAGDLISNGQIFNDPQYANALNGLANMSVLPQSVVDVFRGASTSAIGPDRASFVLRAWDNLRYSTNSVTGGEMVSPAVMAAMDQKDIAKLDMMSGIFTMTGFSPERMQEAVRLFDNYQVNETYKTQVEETLGGTLDEFVSSLSGIDGAMPEDIQAIKAATLGLIGSSQVTGITLDGIVDKLELQIDRSFPNDGNVMNGYGGLRSRSAPSAVLGANAPVFNNFVVERAIRSGFTIDGEKVSAAQMADLNSIDSQSIVGVIGGMPVYSSNVSPDAKKIFLRPDGPPSAEGTSYTVMMWRPFSEGGPVALRQEISIPVTDETRRSLPAGAVANPPKIYPVMSISTSDPEFSRLIKQMQSEREAEAILAGNRRVAADIAFQQGNVFSDPNTIDFGAIFGSVFSGQ